MSKAKKLQRDCPVLGRSMSPADCGSERGSRHQCPSDCPFFPFTPANYDQHLEIESRLIQKMHEGFARTAKDADKGPTMSAFVSGGDGFNASLGAHANLVWLYHGKRDASGLTFGERWVADRNSGLKMMNACCCRPSMECVRRFWKYSVLRTPRWWSVWICSRGRNCGS